jgi:hypothetical protein
VIPEDGIETSDEEEESHSRDKPNLIIKEMANMLSNEEGTSHSAVPDPRRGRRGQ